MKRPGEMTVTDLQKAIVEKYGGANKQQLLDCFKEFEKMCEDNEDDPYVDWFNKVVMINSPLTH